MISCGNCNSTESQGLPNLPELASTGNFHPFRNCHSWSETLWSMRQTLCFAAFTLIWQRSGMMRPYNLAIRRWCSAVKPLAVISRLEVSHLKSTCAEDTGLLPATE